MMGAATPVVRSEGVRRHREAVAGEMRRVVDVANQGEFTVYACDQEPR